MVGHIGQLENHLIARPQHFKPLISLILRFNRLEGEGPNECIAEEKGTQANVREEKGGHLATVVATLATTSH